MTLTELFDKSYAYQLSKLNDEWWLGRAHLPDGGELEVDIAVIRRPRMIRYRNTPGGKLRLREAPAQWEIGFYKDGDDDPNQEGDQFSIFATVIAVVREFMSQVEPQDIVFRAKQNQSEGRIRLYRRFMKKLEAQGWNTREETDPDAVSFYADKWRKQ